MNIGAIIYLVAGQSVRTLVDFALRQAKSEVFLLSSPCVNQGFGTRAPLASRGPISRVS